MVIACNSEKEKNCFLIDRQLLLFFLLFLTLKKEAIFFYFIFRNKKWFNTQFMHRVTVSNERWELQSNKTN